ncbi:DUF2570 domain-containing protein [Arsenophonus apicola]|uniref:DUF2570 domain-containing protein n=1 Tax=Arsenophonus apicola TaxID=2879119 RepID=A0ABY8P5A5_9GAMM|nr:DUF2570 domain-containing protein [Arsenophonus apicola]WGO84676.1 DUF2570 domain-containing protein [Arsenophonus apicola]
MNKPFISLAIISLLIVGGLVFWLEKSSNLQKQLIIENNQLTDKLARQQQIIANQSWQFQRFNHIASRASSHAIQQRAALEERQIEYKTIIKKQPTCDLPVPRAVTDGLLNSVYRLRASAMHSDSEKLDATRSTLITGRLLTYCDLALWIDPLLTNLEQANSQLMAIEKIEDARRHAEAQQH